MKKVLVQGSDNIIASMLKTFRNGVTVLTTEAGAEQGPCTLCGEKDRRIAGLEGDIAQKDDIILGHQEIIDDLKGEIELLSKAPAPDELPGEKEEKPSTTKEDKQANKRSTK